MGDNKLITTIERKIFHFDLPKDAGINLKHEINSIIKKNKHFAEHTVKSRLVNYYPNKSMKTIFRDTKNKTNEPHNLFPNLVQRLDLRSSKKNVAFQSLFVYYTLKNIRQQ